MYTFRSIFIPSLNGWHTATAAAVVQKKNIIEIEITIFFTNDTSKKKEEKKFDHPLQPHHQVTHIQHIQNIILHKRAYSFHNIYKCIFEIHWEENGMRNGRNKKNWDETASTSACAMCGTLKKSPLLIREKKRRIKKEAKKDIVEWKYKKISIPSLFSLVESNIHQLLWLWPFSHTLHNHNHPFFPLTDAWLTKRKRFFFFIFSFFSFFALLTYISYPLLL